MLFLYAGCAALLGLSVLSMADAAAADNDPNPQVVLDTTAGPITLELDAGRAAQARDFLGRAGVSQRVELVEGDARETIAGLDGPFDLLFVDAAKRRVLQLLSRRQEGQAF